MTKEEINKICKEYGINSCTINKDMSIDVDGDVDLSYQKFKQLPLTFNKVSGDFYCDSSNLTSLQGSPKEVGKDFLCSDCINLTSLQGAPKEVSGNFSCCSCQNLTLLQGAPKEVSGNFSCSSCPKLISLQGAPKEVGGYFDCDHCPNLTSLQGAPNKVSGSFEESGLTSGECCDIIKIVKTTKETHDNDGMRSKLCGCNY